MDVSPAADATAKHAATPTKRRYKTVNATEEQMDLEEIHRIALVLITRSAKTIRDAGAKPSNSSTLHRASGGGDPVTIGRMAEMAREIRRVIQLGGTISSDTVRDFSPILKQVNPSLVPTLCRARVARGF